jgi:competence protein ComEC
LAVLSLDFVEQLIAHAVTLPAASVNIPELDPGKRFYLLLPLCWVVLPPAWPGRYIAVIAALALIVHEPARPAHGCADVDVLDVGQGLAVVITTQHSVLLFDTGPAFRSGGSAMESVVLPFLAHRGIKHIDNVVVSHADLDHAGGVDALLRRMPVGLLHVGERLGDARPGRLCDAGQNWLVDGVRFDILHPRADTERSGNNASCVLQLSAGEHRLLLTGDIEGPAEAALSRSGALQPVDAVVVPHHGSGTSSGTAFVQVLRPSVAIVSAGFDNRWGLPKSEVVERWQGAGAAVHVTATAGAISMRLCEQGGIVSLDRHRVERRRIWHE